MLGVEAKGPILVVHRVVVTPGQERPGAEYDRTFRSRQRPDHGHRAGAVLNENLLHHPRAIGHLVLPRRPWIAGEPGQVSGAVWMEHVRRIALRRERERPAGCIDPRVEAVDQNDPARWWRRRREQQRVISTCPHPGRRPRGEPTEAVGLEPFRPIIDLHVSGRHAQNARQRSALNAPIASAILV